jgi:signal transduction histidine kinase
MRDEECRRWAQAEETNNKMEANQTNLSTKMVPARDLYAELKRVSIFQQVKVEDLDCLGEVEVVDAPAGARVLETGEPELFYWVLLDGELRATKPEADGGSTLLATWKAGETFGEVPLLTGAPATFVHADATTDSRMVRISVPAFWRMMSTCPVVRGGVLANMGRRLEAYQVLTLHREKLISLGTLAAGLMHELNNPGAAARRAASQLRENLTRLQQISLRFSERELTPAQKHCMSELQQEALQYHKPRALSSMEQADAEEALLQWLESAGVENAWKLAPTLVTVGWECGDLECAHHAFPPEILSDALNWLEALISSMQLVGTVEESIARVTDLVVAVKKYAYDDKNREREIDLHDSIQSTITILAHKFRHKQLIIEKFFAADMPTIKTTGTGLSQVWTNILDNAIDASPENGRVTIRTWRDGNEACVGIADQGPGVPDEFRDHIFEPFFTTKPAGVGTGLGLDIAHRIVVGQFKGKIEFTSEPGKTEFIVRVPAAS